MARTSQSGPARWASFLRDSLRTWSGWVMLATLVSLGIHAHWIIFRWGDPMLQVVFGLLFVAPIYTAAVVLCIRFGLSQMGDLRVRRAWLLLGCGFGGYLLGTLLIFYYTVVVGSVSYPSLADVAYLSLYPLAIWGLLTFPSTTRQRERHITFWLDVGIVLLGGGMAIWYFVLGPHVLSDSENWLLVALAIAYPIGDLVLIFGLAIVALRGVTGASHVALRILIIALIVNATADLGYGSLLLQGTYDYTSWPNVVWSLAGFGFVVSAQYQHWEASRGREQVTGEGSGSFDWLPYVAIAIGYTILLLASRSLWDTPIGGLIVVAVGLTALVVARQLQAVRAARASSTQIAQAKALLEQMNQALEQRVAERTTELEAALTNAERRATEQARLLEEIERQRDVIREMSVPVLPVNDTTLVMPLIGALDTARLAHIQEQALDRIGATRARYLLLDITGVSMVDSQVAQGLLRVVRAARLLGAEVVLVGIRPEVAQAIVGLGLDLSGIVTHATLQSGLAYVFARVSPLAQQGRR